jgi:hypothetical protein
MFQNADMQHYGPHYTRLSASVRPGFGDEVGSWVQPIRAFCWGAMLPVLGCAQPCSGLQHPGRSAAERVGRALISAEDEERCCWCLAVHRLRACVLLDQSPRTRVQEAFSGLARADRPRLIGPDPS